MTDSTPRRREPVAPVAFSDPVDAQPVHQAEPAADTRHVPFAAPPAAAERR